MARARGKTKRGRRPSGGAAKKSVSVRPHGRSPRGDDSGKARPSVRSHRRKRPKASSYPRFPRRRRKRRSTR